MMRVSLILGSGGARGYAHIGVIRELEAPGHDVVTISGTSMSAVIGGLYACGKMDEFAA
ncbi:patatin-like phospholipase family protein [Trueperella pecoris]|uniref:patatin-like phospholipase family protein n=1 Tax=Trueperella pecoris TaxID=2733571 RepID=UPI0018D49A75|nr:patatin-like phospholipase family protein [Trueperella pecoris]